MKFLVLLILYIPINLFSQKTIYIPQEWINSGFDYSMDRSVQSDNFIVFWGPLAGIDPATAPPEIAFDPQSILNTAEELYTFYIDTIQFVNDDSGLISQYKIILVMLHTWTGLEGWAFGGNYDGIVGAMWMHPHAASSGPTLAHEFTHTLQNYTWMMNPGHGFIDSSYVGFFWETHAEFMALQRYPSVALEFDMARWLNTSQFHWSSTRHHYQAFIFLQFIKEKDGITMINRLWNESNIGEHPLETYKRLKGITQDSLNNLFGEYAMRNVTWDYEIGDLLRERISTINPVFISHQTIIPELIDSTRNWYRIQNHLAPQDYGYNIIRLYVDSVSDECDKRFVYLNFKKQDIWPDYEEAGLRYGFVAVNDESEPRYSELFSKDEELAFEMMDDEHELYLIISGAPVNHHNYAWEIGFPRIYRYPYDFRLKGAVPEGFQEGFRAPQESEGTFHANGGGFVGINAVVASTAYVGPNAQVLGGAQVLDNARIEDFAIVTHSATVENNAVVSGLAIVGETARVSGNAIVTSQAHVYGASQVYDSAYVGGNALIFHTSVYENARLTENTFTWSANLHGDIVLGGDAEFFSECSDGTYKQVEWAYERNCDGLDDHPANADVTSIFFSDWHDSNLSLVCDSLLQNYFYEEVRHICEGDTFYFYGDTLTSEGIYEKIFEAVNGADSIISVLLRFYPSVNYSSFVKLCKGDTVIIFGDAYYEEGLYPVDSTDAYGCLIEGHLILEWFVVDTTVARQGNRLVALATASTFQWYDCSTGLPVPGASQRTFVPDVPGSYKVEVTDINGCSEFSGCYDMILVSISDIENHLEWKVVPNPAADYVEVLLSIPSRGTVKIEIIDFLGNAHIATQLPSGENQVRIDLTKLLPGIYMIRGQDFYGRSTLRKFSKF